MSGDGQGNLFGPMSDRPRPATEESYYNTTRSRGADLANYEQLAQQQESRILSFFRQGGRHAPSAVHAAVTPEAPITSCRRAITNLTQRGLLRKTDEQRVGPLGRPEYLWEITT